MTAPKKAKIFELKTTRISMVIPCYNESGRVSSLFKGLQEFDAEWKDDYEVILVNDGSKDNTVDLINNDPLFKKLTEQGKAKLIDLKKNQGKGGAIKAGVEQATGTHILTLDVDMATHPLELKNWLKTLGSFPDDEILIASREHKGSEITEKAHRKVTGKFFNICVHLLTPLSIEDTQCGFKLYPANVAKFLFKDLKVKGWAHDVEVLYKAELNGVRIHEMPVKWDTQEGSKISIIKDSFGMFFQILQISLMLKWQWYIVQPLKNLFGDKNVVVSPESRYRLFFILYAFFLLLFMPAISSDFGITGDEHVQKEYGEKVLNYFATFGKDESSLNYKNLYFYGGFFDGLCAFVNKIFPSFDDYNVRHFINALFGFLAMLFTGLLAKETGGWRLGLLAILFISITPAFFGHSMNNPKDIPFAAAYVFTLYFLFKFLKQLPVIRLGSLLMLTIGIAFAINIRVGGILLIAYLWFFAGLVWLFKSYFNKDNTLSLMELVKPLAIVSIAGYFLGLLFWPYGWESPISNPLSALREMEKFSTTIGILFEGKQISSADVPWYYIPKWMSITLPLFMLIGLLIALFTVPFSKRSTGKFLAGILLFAFVFPVAYAIYKKSILYDSWRHFLFIYPPLVVFGTLGWNNLLTYFKGKGAKIAIVAVIIILCFLPVKWMIKNHPNEYVYFNEMFGGIEKAYGRYETDYWMNSMKPASEWFIQNIGTKDSVIIATNCMEPVKYYMKQWAPNTKVIYTRYYERGEKDWDYAFLYSRFVDNNQLLNRSWPPQKVIHTVAADEIPLAVIVKRPSDDEYLGFQAIKQNNIPAALNHFSKAVILDPLNESVWAAYARVLLSSNQLTEGEKALQKSLMLYPGNVDAMLLSVNLMVFRKDFNNAILTLNQIINMKPQFAPQGYQMLAQIYQQKGDMQTAQQYYNAAKQFSNQR